ncbi:helix-turn-helix transcriptional regulator [Solwaraspora sp. WMMD406]|uniref:helix-turn-helix domain-containing protein n=1 Tax=Solwaraspora sp. WMMD406 TaxID=3016095 RepID=UPI002417D238|nr:helix-turn-helix transcriptional regulator [Solwaraspora sp. WMMD406]MDG4766646.1 helix-turn-helix transcriptional regulator [Solwaraspora sp. WMMD406]
MTTPRSGAQLRRCEGCEGIVSGSEYLVGELRRLREMLGLTQEAWGDRVHFSTSHVGSIERGDRPALPDYLGAVDKAFGTAFVNFYREFVVGERAPVWYRPFIEHESRATMIRIYQPLIVPGLLQTAAYARAVLAAHGLHGDELETALTTRLGRQEVLNRPQPCRLVAVLDESALLRRVAEPEVMREQLKAVAAAGERPHISVQVVPADAAAHPGLDGPFVIATVDGRSVGYLEGHLQGRVVESPDDTADLERIWEGIRDYALPGHQSLDMIMRTAETWI